MENNPLAVITGTSQGIGRALSDIHEQMGISFEEYCRVTGYPDFISPEELAEVVMFCWKQPQKICIRDIVVMPTNSAF
jgi:NADP-dependent 3-hydroxy acid dehydrogenase YdfG